MKYLVVIYSGRILAGGKGESRSGLRSLDVRLVNQSSTYTSARQVLGLAGWDL